MLAIAAWEFIDRQRLNRPFHQLWEIIKHIDYIKAFNQLLEHLEYHKASNKLSEIIKHIDYHKGFNQLLEIISHIDVTAAVSAAATIVIAVFSATLWWVNRRQGSDARIIQRAYVKISHLPPGVEVNPSGNFWLKASIKNFGQTPARVTDIVMKPAVVAHNESLPTIPDYTCEDSGPPLRAFLVKDDEFFLPRHYSITQYQMKQVREHSADLYVIGFVDYRDQFGERHRGGYARRYYPVIDDMKYENEAERAKRNNLLVFAQERYNYDRRRHRGEGKDWSEDT
jgi:hypothetical protein